MLPTVSRKVSCLACVAVVVLAPGCAADDQEGARRPAQALKAPGPIEGPLDGPNGTIADTPLFASPPRPGSRLATLDRLDRTLARKLPAQYACVVLPPEPDAPDPPKRERLLVVVTAAEGVGPARKIIARLGASKRARVTVDSDQSTWADRQKAFRVILSGAHRYRFRRSGLRLDAIVTQTQFVDTTACSRPLIRDGPGRYHQFVLGLDRRYGSQIEIRRAGESEVLFP